MMAPMCHYVHTTNTTTNRVHDERSIMSDILEIPTRKVCRATGFVGLINQDDPADNDFYRDRSQKDGFAPWCKQAERDYNKAYRAGLKAAKASKVANIDDPKLAKKYNKAHEDAGTRVARGTFDTTPPKRGKRAKVRNADA